MSNINLINNSSDVEFIKLTSSWKSRLIMFSEAMEKNGDNYYFSPHSFREEEINKIVLNPGKDLYYLMIQDDKLLGYGLLRGWNEGYEIPSLGIAIQPSAQGKGLGKIFMRFLHNIASQKGATKVRLRVRKNNEKAIKMYKNLGYVFEEDSSNSEYFLGFKNIDGDDYCEV